MSGDLTLQQTSDIADSIVKRRDRFPDEDLHTSIMVVLLNAGEKFTKVDCVAGEWSGAKADLSGGAGIPKCPNGHVLTERAERVKLGWVDDGTLIQMAVDAP